METSGRTMRLLLTALSPEDAAAAVLQVLVNEISVILKIDAVRVEADQVIADLGMDSLPPSSCVPLWKRGWTWRSAVHPVQRRHAARHVRPYRPHVGGTCHAAGRRGQPHPSVRRGRRRAMDRGGAVTAAGSLFGLGAAAKSQMLSRLALQRQDRGHNTGPCSRARAAG